MLPPILRGGVIGAILKAMLQPLVWTLQRFDELRATSSEILSSNGQSISLVEAIRRSYYLEDGDVYIVDSKDMQSYLYRVAEGQKTIALYKIREATPHRRLYYSDEGKVEPDFYIYLPDFLELDEINILRLIEQYKPAGRKYQIRYYQYE